MPPGAAGIMGIPTSVGSKSPKPVLNDSLLELSDTDDREIEPWLMREDQATSEFDNGVDVPRDRVGSTPALGKFNTGDVEIESESFNIVGVSPA